MKAKDYIIIILLIFSLLVTWVLLDERQRAKRKDEIIDKLRKENDELKKAYLSLLEEHLRKQPDLEPSVLRELQKLKSEIDELDSPTHLELDSVVRHVVQKEYSKAVRDLAKILEVVLRKKINNDVSSKRQQNFHSLIEYARNCKWITDQEFHNLQQLKDVRNKESHELAVVIHPIDAGLMVFAGIKTLYTVSRKKVI